MKKLTLLPFILFVLMNLIILSCKKNETETDMIDFEELVLEEDSFWNGSDGSGGFASGNAFFPNDYYKDEQYEFWNGFAYTNITDTETGNFTNQYAAVTGSGAGGSDNYAVFYQYLNDTITFNIPEKITNISVCNTTWAYTVMKEGDDWGTPKMGGEDGKSPDYFTLVINGFNKAGEKTGIARIYLADFDPERVVKGYISNMWTDIDLSGFGYVSKLSFGFESNIKNEFGILIPAYVCIDNIEGVLQPVE